MIGTGLGRQLWQHALSTASAAGFTSLRVEADPNAEGFYRAMGARRVSQAPSASVPGRFLPVLEMRLVPAAKTRPAP
ncbi:MAG: GNAT family N-acetyltransferase [Streptosporangiaceae bacterium]